MIIIHRTTPFFK